MMNRALPSMTAFAMMSLFTSSAVAGQFKRITIDGSFEDWLGVPVAATNEVAAAGQFDMKDVAIANDEDYLYVRVRLHSSSNYADFNHQVIVDTDADGTTGYAWGGIGSELFVENGASYQQKNGQFNEGAGSGLGWAVSPAGESRQFEMRISRAARDAEGVAFFNGEDVLLSLMTRSLEWQLLASLEAVPYTFATKPEPFQGSKVLTDFTDTFWFYQEIGDPEPDWLLPDYFGDDTWQGGNGFFSFGLDENIYPVDAHVPLTPGRTTYYFRTPFVWEHAAEGVALLADAFFSDGAVIYLNGDEVKRIRMPEGEIDGSTPGLGGPETPSQAERFSLPPSALIVGENLLMVEMHQSADSMGSLAFGLTLTANDSVPPALEDPGKPEDREVVEGERTVFVLGSIAGTEPFTFQWYKGQEPIPEAKGARLEIPLVLQEDAGTYYAEVGNDSGMIESRVATLTTTALPVSFLNETMPEDQTLHEGETIVLAVEVTGSPNIDYQWYKNDVPLDAREAELTIAVAQLENSGDYHVTVSNRLNSVPSRKARVTVRADREAPRVDRMIAASGSIILEFSEALSEDSATDAAHFTVPGIEVRQAFLAEDGRTVTLETGPMVFGQDYQLAIEGVEDRFGNPLTASIPFRATILIDGDFDDWDGIEPVISDPQENDGHEFKTFWVANDDEFLYLRFSFHQEIGRLPVDFYYQIFIDGDNDASTGLSVSTIGSSLMIENGNGWLQQGGAFNEGSVGNTNFLMAPVEASAEFECRIALSSSRDGSAIFTADTVGIAFNLVSTNWEVIDSGPVEAIIYPLKDWPSLAEPGPVTPKAPLTIRMRNGQVELLWQEGSLETSETLLPNSWQPVGNATSPHLPDFTEDRRFYRTTD